MPPDIIPPIRSESLDVDQTGSTLSGWDSTWFPQERNQPPGVVGDTRGRVLDRSASPSLVSRRSSARPGGASEDFSLAVSGSSERLEPHSTDAGSVGADQNAGLSVAPAPDLSTEAQPPAVAQPGPEPSTPWTPRFGSEEPELNLFALLDSSNQELQSGGSEVLHGRELLEWQRHSQGVLDTQHQEQIRDMQQALAIALQEIRDVQSDCESLRQRNAELRRQHGQLELQSTARADELEHELAKVRFDLITGLADNESLRERITELRRQREHLEWQSHQRASQLEQELSKTRLDLITGLAENDSLRERNANLVRQRDALEQQSQDRIRELEVQMAALRRDLEERQAQAEVVEELQQERDALRTLEQQLRQELETLRGEAEISTEPPVLPGREEALLEECTRLEDELMAVNRLLEDLPDIYERKFLQRIQSLIEQRDWLLQENYWLREALNPPSTDAEEPASVSEAPQLPPARLRLGQALQTILRLGRPTPARAVVLRNGASPEPVDDGPPTAASADPRRR